MESVLHYTSVRQADAVMSAVNKMRLDSDLCDVVLVVGNIRIQAHRLILAASAPFFYQKLTSRSGSPPTCECRLDNVDELAAIKIIEFCYTGTISVPEEDLQDVLTAAMIVGCQEVSELCCEMLAARLTVATCVQTHLMAASLGCDSLMMVTGEFLADNIDKVYGSEAFLHLSSDDMFELVASMQSLNVDDNQMLKCLCAWLDQVREGREPLVLQLIEEFPVFTETLNGYLDQPISMSGAVVTCRQGTDTSGVSQRTANNEKTTLGTSSDEFNDDKSQQLQLEELLLDVSVSHDEFPMGHCQTNGNIPESDSSVQFKTRTKMHPGQQSHEKTSCVPMNNSRLPGLTPSANLVKNCHADSDVDNSCGHNDTETELHQKTCLSTPAMKINKYELNLYHHHRLRHHQKWPGSFKRKEVLRLYKEENGFVSRMRCSRKQRRFTTYKDQTNGEELQQGKPHLLKETRAITTATTTVSTAAATVVADAELRHQKQQRQDASFNKSVTKRHACPNDSHGGQVSIERPERLAGFISVAELAGDHGMMTASLRGIQTRRIGDNYSSIHDPGNGIHDSCNDIDDNCSGVDDRCNRVDGKCNDVNDNSDSTEGRRVEKNDADARGLVSQKPHRQTETGGTGWTIVHKLRRTKTPNRDKDTFRSGQEVTLVDKSLMQTASKSEVMSGFRSSTKLQLLKCFVCQWAFKERSALIKHRQMVHGLKQDVLHESNSAVLTEDRVEMTECQNEDKKKTGHTRQLRTVNCESEDEADENKCVGTNNRRHLSRTGNNKQPPDFSNSYQPGSSQPSCLYLGQGSEVNCTCALRQETGICTHKISMCTDNEHNLLSSGGQGVLGETGSSWIKGTDVPLDMSKSSKTFPSDVSAADNSPLDLSKTCNRNHRSPVGDYSRESIHLNTWLAEAAPNVLSIDGNGFVYSPALGYDMPLTSRITDSFRLPLDFLFNDAHVDERATREFSCQQAPAATDNLSRCSEENFYSISVEKGSTSRQTSPSGSCSKVFGFPAAWFHNPASQYTPRSTCRACHQTFLSSHDLKGHSCHSGSDKPLTCPHCEHTFAKKIHLKRHLATHSGLKPYPCWVCGKRFSRSDHLKRHTQSLHSGSRPHGCDVCGKEFVRKYELNKHMAVHKMDMSVLSN